MQQPFETGQELVCTNDKPLYGDLLAPWMLKKDDKYLLTNIAFLLDEWWCEISIQPGVGYPAAHFAPVTRLRISDKLTIAEGLATEPVEERADYVIEKIEVCQ